MSMSADLLLVVLAFVLGACLARRSLCMVAAIREYVVERRLVGVYAQLIALCAAGAVLTLLATALPGVVQLPADRGVSLPVVVGAVILGAGALVNGGCYLGSVLYLGRGRSEFLFTLVGIAAASRLAPASSWLSMQTGAAVRSLMGDPPYLATGVFVLVAVVVAAALRGDRVGRRALIRALLGAAITGTIAGLLYARHPHWSYGSVLDALAHADARAIDWVANAAAAALFAGALTGSWLAGDWQLRRPSWLRSLRCLAGGALMGVGAALIPGGNDLLVLWAVPGLTAYGIVAYATLVATIALPMVVARRWPGIGPKPATPSG